LKRARKRAVPGTEAAAEAFYEAVLTDAVCVMCGADHGLFEAHHAVPKRHLRTICRSLGMSPVEALAVVYDPAFGVALCSEYGPERCHPRHTLGFRTVPRSRIPERVFVAAEELGVEAVVALEREHPDEGSAL
jgi:hypothetical protein